MASQNSSKNKSWRTGSPTRLHQLVANQSWDPSMMFGAPPRPSDSTSPQPPAVQEAPRALAPMPAKPAPFAVPEWCAAPQGAASAQLLVWRDAALVDTIPLGGKHFFVVGRNTETCDIALEHASASRHHAAVLHHRSGAIYLLDLGSAHGTFLNGDRLPPKEPTLWSDGATCVFGASSRSYVLRLSAGTRMVPRPAAPSSHTQRPCAPALGDRAAPASRPPHSHVGGPLPRAGLSDLEQGCHAGSADPEPVVADLEMDAVCLANTRANICIPAERSHGTRADVEPQGSSSHRPAAALLGVHRTHGHSGDRKRRRVTFDAGPPSVRFFEPPSPEPIHDPEDVGAASAADGKPVPSSGGGAHAPVAPASLPRPKCVVSFSSGSKRALDADSPCQGQFANLAAVGISSGSASSHPSSSLSACSGAASIRGRLSALYAAAPSTGSDDEGSCAVVELGAPQRLLRGVGGLLSSERQEGAALGRALSQAGTSPRVDVGIECHIPVGTPVGVSAPAADATTRTAPASLVAVGSSIAFESSSGQRLLTLHWQSPAQNPLSDGRSPVRYRGTGGGGVSGGGVCGGAGAERRVGVASIAPRRDPAAAGCPISAMPLALSIVNPQRKPILVYVALRWQRPPEGGATSASEAATPMEEEEEGEEAALTPWEGATPDEERPRPLSAEEVDGEVRGANCLLLAPLEGTAQCEAEDAETAPFGESNTFKYVAGSGLPAEIPPEARNPVLRIETSYQMSSIGGAAGGVGLLLGAEYDDLVADAPFLVATIPLNARTR